MSKKNRKNLCINNFKGYCNFGKSKYFSKHCNAQNCNYYTNYNTPKYKVQKQQSNNIMFDVDFIKENEKLLLKIHIPMNYKSMSRLIQNKYWFNIKYTQKDKSIDLNLVLNDLESYIFFLFNDFHNLVFVNSGVLNIILKDIPEITNNTTPYNQITKNIKIKRILTSDYGKLTLDLRISKELAFGAVSQLFKKEDINSKIINRKDIDIYKSKKLPLLKKPENKVESQLGENITKSTQKTSHIQPSLQANAIVLSYNRKCFNENHSAIDVTLIIKVVTKIKVIDMQKPGIYCPVCNQYIMLKTDYKDLKKSGALLCQVVDKTPKYLEKHKNQSYSGTESRIHSLGYNVIKQYGYTFEQRKVILANIIENYNISKQKILSMIDTNIARKNNLPSYAEAVHKWQEDREFISNYKTGDIPEVVIDKIIVGRRV